MKNFVCLLVFLLIPSVAFSQVAMTCNRDNPWVTVYEKKEKPFIMDWDRLVAKNPKQLNADYVKGLLETDERIPQNKRGRPSLRELNGQKLESLVIRYNPCDYQTQVVPEFSSDIVQASGPDFAHGPSMSKALSGIFIGLGSTFAMAYLPFPANVIVPTASAGGLTMFNVMKARNKAKQSGSITGPASDISVTAPRFANSLAGAKDEDNWLKERKKRWN